MTKAQKIAKQKREKEVSILKARIIELEEQELFSNKVIKASNDCLLFIEKILGAEAKRQPYYTIFQSRKMEEEKSTLEERVIAAVIKLKIDFDREDESSMVESEKSSMLLDVILSMTKDEARLKEIDVEKELVLAGFVKEWNNGKFRWVKIQNN